VVRLEIHVQPGTSRAGVGGEHDGALIVRVTEPAEGGRATNAALRAVADALTLPRRSVSLAYGATSRHKVIDIETDGNEGASVELAIRQLRLGTKP
jgi:hypothetical protein